MEEFEAIYAIEFSNEPTIEELAEEYHIQKDQLILEEHIGFRSEAELNEMRRNIQRIKKQLDLQVSKTYS